MRCPIDDTELKMSERQGIEIDYCPKCRGVWLGRGELDKIIERAAGESQAHAAPPADIRARSEQRPREDDRYHDNRSRDDDREYRPYKKRKSLLDDIFDF